MGNIKRIWHDDEIGWNRLSDEREIKRPLAVFDSLCCHRLFGVINFSRFVLYKLRLVSGETDVNHFTVAAFLSHKTQSYHRFDFKRIVENNAINSVVIEEQQQRNIKSTIRRLNPIQSNLFSNWFKKLFEKTVKKKSRYCDKRLQEKLTIKENSKKNQTGMKTFEENTCWQVEFDLNGMVCANFGTIELNKKSKLDECSDTHRNRNK